MTYFKQYYLGCLSHASYLIGDGGEAVVVDPQRDVEQYLADAADAGLTIKHVVETHLHADFVSGHVELARRTGARIHIGARAGAEFPHVPVRDGDELAIGGTVLRFLETPGHTPEGISILVLEGGRPTRVLTGDTLFIGDVGRPDLVGSKGHSAEQMAGMLHDSLRRLMTLPDEVEVFPAHGAGSSCGRFISNERSSTIGEQRRTNYALRPMTREAFVSLVTRGLPPPPRYFAHDAETNRRGAPELGALPRPPGLSPDEVAARVERGAVVLDVRTPDEFAAGHVPGSINIGLRGNFAPWAGSLLDVGKPLVLVAGGDADVAEATLRLARVGIESVTAYLDGGVEAWARAGWDVAVMPRITVDELHRRAGEGPLQLLDVRTPAEHASGHAPGARLLPLAELTSRVASIRRDVPVYLMCGSGYRSTIAASLLAHAGVENAIDVAGGHGAWTQAGYPLEKRGEEEVRP